MRALGTVLKWVILLPVLAAILLLAVANGQIVTVHLNPFDAADPVLRLDLPLYQLAFVLFILGVLIGALVAWSSQMKHRRRERARRDEAVMPALRPSPERPAATAGFLPRPERG